MYKNRVVSLDEHQIFLEGPVVVFKWKNATDWPVEYVSSNIETNLGYKKEDLLTGRIKYADIIFEDDLPRVFNEVKNYSSSERSTFEQEYRVVKKDGDVIWIYDYTTVVRDKEGNITHYYGYILDITKHKKNEEVIRKTEKLKTVGEFAAGIAHEIRNPLTSIKGFLKLIKSGQIQGEYVNIMESELDRIELILNEFLVISKPQLVQFNKINIKKLINQIYPLFETQVIYKNIDLVIDLCEEELFVDGNENQLKQVFINLIKNALEAMPDGGVIKIKCRKKEDTLSISVMDEGQGISEKNLASLGTPFFTTKENGTGLGLMISFKIIKEHGGMIRVESKLGEGSTFEILLPLTYNNKM